MEDNVLDQVLIKPKAARINWIISFQDLSHSKVKSCYTKTP